MFLVALTGNYGMGKSTVLSLFRKVGVSTLDADKIVLSLLKKKEILKKMKQLMGNTVFNVNGSLNKKRVAGIIFKTPSLRRSLEDLLHPFVFERIRDFVDKIKVHDKILIIAVPLVYERGYENSFNKIIVVYTTEEIALYRLGKKRVSRKDALLRRAALRKEQLTLLVDNYCPDTNTNIINASFHASFLEAVASGRLMVSVVP